MATTSYKSISLSVLQTILTHTDNNKLLLVTGIGMITGTSVNWHSLPDSETNTLKSSGKNLAEYALSTTDITYSQLDKDSDPADSIFSAIALKDVKILTSCGKSVEISSLIVYTDQIIAASIAN